MSDSHPARLPEVHDPLDEQQRSSGGLGRGRELQRNQQPGLRPFQRLVSDAPGGGRRWLIAPALEQHQRLDRVMVARRERHCADYARF